MTPDNNANPVQTIKATKHYGTDPVVHNVSLSVSTGEVFGLLGPNGAGKTTLLRMIGGMIRPTRGEVLIFGREAFARDPETSRRLGIVLDDPLAHGLEHLPASEYLRFFSRLYGVSCEKERILSLLSVFALQEHSQKQIGKFSRGMIQKLNIARALLHCPQILLLDEPTAGLDPCVTLDLRKVLVERRSEGGTIVISSHILSEVERICDRVAIINHGHIVYEGTLDTSFKPPKSVSVTVAVNGKAQELELIRTVKTAITTGLSVGLKRGGRRRHRILISLEVSDAERAANLAEDLIEKGFDVRSIEAKNPTLEEMFAGAISEDGSDAGP